MGMEDEVGWERMDRWVRSMILLLLLLLLLLLIGGVGGGKGWYGVRSCRMREVFVCFYLLA